MQGVWLERVGKPEGVRVLAEQEEERKDKKLSAFTKEKKVTEFADVLEPLSQSLWDQIFEEHFGASAVPGKSWNT